MQGLLSVLIWLPIGAGVVVLLLGERNIVAAKWLSLLAARSCALPPSGLLRLHPSHLR